MKYALVTGAGAGIGWSCVEKLLNDGVTVYMATLQKEIESKKDFFEQWEQKGLHPVAYDALDLQTYETLFEKISAETGGKLDYLVNNFGWTNPLIDLDIERIAVNDFGNIVQSNLTGIVTTIQKSIPMMKETGGAIVNIASIAAHVPDMTELAYGTVKAGVCHITKQCATQLAHYGIRVNAVLPGITATDSVKNALTPEFKQFFLRHVPLNRMANPDEIADAVNFFLKSEYATGQCLEVSGGFGTATPLYADMMAMAIQMGKSQE